MGGAAGKRTQVQRRYSGAVLRAAEPVNDGRVARLASDAAVQRLAAPSGSVSFLDEILGASPAAPSGGIVQRKCDGGGDCEGAETGEAAAAGNGDGEERAEAGEGGECGACATEASANPAGERAAPAADTEHPAMADGPKKDPPATGKKKSPQEKATELRAKCDTKCGTSVGELGSTECEIDASSGMPTGNTVGTTATSDPCIAPCVEKHEQAHVKDLTPVCKVAGQCIDRAKGDANKEWACMEAMDNKIYDQTAKTECKAYSAEQKCMNKRKKKTPCKTSTGKKMWGEHMKMVKCYKACFCG